jgi:O-antigen biosynthesis protein
MSTSAHKATTRPPVWQTHLNAADTELADYHQFLDPQLADLFVQPPKLMLDIGCAAGQFGALVKQKYPQTRVIGVELNKAAAAAARQKLDHVFEQKIEDIDFAEAGIAPGSIDAVILADVLEHLYDPWRVMLGLKQHLSADAQIIASIPNTRHLGLTMGLLDGGQWQYADRGLLDITHIRFFTLAQIKQLFAETGYRIERINCNIDPNFHNLLQQNMNKPSVSLRFGRVVLENISGEELRELCTWQFYVRARPLQ